MSNIEDRYPFGVPCAPPCGEENCIACASAECPHGDPMHRHHDGCTTCWRYDTD